MTKRQSDGQEQAIDDHLRKVFDETLHEGIPDRFRDLLSQLKEQDQQNKDTSK